MQSQREGLVVFVTENGSIIGVLATIEKGKFNVVHGLNAIPFTKKDSVSSIRRLIGELPTKVQAIVRDYANRAKATLTQDAASQPVLLRWIEVPKTAALDQENLMCLRNRDIARVQELQAPNIELIRKAFGSGE